jgi:hypothetical protein
VERIRNAASRTFGNDGKYTHLSKNVVNSDMNWVYRLARNFGDFAGNHEV